MRLDEGVHAELVRVLEQLGDSRVGEVTQQEEHGVGTGDLELQQLQLLAEESLRQQRHRGCGARGLEVRERAAEALVDEDRDGRRARVRELQCKPRRIRVRPEIARRRRAALHLGDRAEAGDGECVAEAPHQTRTS